MDHALDQYLSQQDAAYADKFDPDRAIVRRMYPAVDISLSQQHGLERQRFLVDWIERHYWRSVPGDLWDAFWKRGVTSLGADGYYVLNFDEQKKILDLVEVVGLDVFLAEFVKTGDLSTAVAVFEEE